MDGSGTSAGRRLESVSAIFQHGVASGDPLQDSVVIWTRITTPEASAEVRYTVAHDPELRNVTAAGAARTDASCDYTVSVDVKGLDPGSTYYYGFEALGERSPVARTKTLPPDDVSHLRFAIVSCVKFNAGFFNAYARIAEREDLDFLLHLGDYIYEAANKPPASQTPGADIGRHFEPLHECVTLADYRTRYAQYRRDSHVQRVHHVHPFIATVDDHEFADGAWRSGSVEHKAKRDGPWESRRAAAFQARSEWLPIRPPDPSDPERVFRTIRLGNLADLFLIDTRTRRDELVDGPPMYDPTRSQLGREQRDWLLGDLAASKATWRLLANSSVMGQTWDERLPESAKQSLIALKMIAKGGAGPDPDQWDGYPAERELIFDCFRHHPGGNIVVLSGDIHASLAIELKSDPRDPHEEPFAVEVVTTSVTSQNVDEKLGWQPRTACVAIERAIVAAVPHIRWCELESHGYVIIDLCPKEVRAEWWHVDTVLEPAERESRAAAWKVESGRPQLVPA